MPASRDASWNVSANVVDGPASARDVVVVTWAVFRILKKRLPTPSAAPVESVTSQPMIWVPLAYCVVSMKSPRPACVVLNCGKPAEMSARGDTLGTPGRKTPSTATRTPVAGIVEPAVGVLVGVSTHPVFGYMPLAVAPCPGVSIDPKGLVDAALLTVIDLDPSVTVLPSLSVASAYSLNGPPPSQTRPRVSIR